MNWKTIKTREDLPDTAGYEVLVTIEAKYTSLLSVTTAFIGYGDDVWYTMDKGHMQDPNGRDNRLSSAYKVIAWADKPKPYNPYLIDGRRVIKKCSERIKSDRSTMEIKKDIIPMIEGMMNKE